MKKHVLFIVLLVIVFSGQGRSENAIQFTVTPSIGHSFGETEYILDISSYIADDNGDIITDEFGNPVVFRLKSQLEYPLDVAMAGVTVGLAPAGDPSFWSVKAGVFSSVNDPGGIMKDHDWLGPISDVIKFSYTESVADMNSVLIDIEATRRIMSPGEVRVGALAGFRYHRIEQDLYGAVGWQLRTLTDTVDTNIPDSIKALSYEVKYYIPQAGLNTNLELSPNLSLSAKTVLALVWFTDVDDHPLRNKLSKADGTGAGFIGSLSARYLLGQTAAGMAPYIGLFAEYTTLKASGDQTQTWYGDDPVTVEDDTDKSTTVPHDINANWYHIGLNLGLSF